MTQEQYETMRSNIIKALQSIESFGVDAGYTKPDNRALMTRAQRRELVGRAFEKGAASGRLTPIENID